MTHEKRTCNIILWREAKQTRHESRSHEGKLLIAYDEFEISCFKLFMSRSDELVSHNWSRNYVTACISDCKRLWR